MTREPASAEAVTTLEPARDGRLVPYCAIAIGGLGAALLAGQPALAALAAPFVLALALGLRRTGPVEVRARVVLDDAQVLEGDAVTGRIEISWSGACDARVILHELKGVAAPGDGPPAWALPAPGERIEFPITLHAGQWGRHTIGEVWLRLEAPYGLLSWTGRVATCPTLRVLPGSERLTRLLEPSHSRTVLGVHRSARLGDGHEFAELRPYVAGDRLRSLNWAATARHRRPLVNVHHPEQSGDVIVAVDAFADRSTGSMDALARAARAAWALASSHLRANDRVGIVAFGGSTRWLPPAGGQRARYRVLETLLDIGGEVAEGVARRDDAYRTAVPANALIVALTPLHDYRTVRTLQGWRARGHGVAVVVVDTLRLFGDDPTPAAALARRMWGMELERRKRELVENGIALVTLAEDGTMAGAVTALRRARRGRALRRGR